MPPLMKGEHDANKFATHIHGCAAFKTNKDLTEFEMLGMVENRPLGLLEPTMIELRDGRLVMLMRAEWGGFLWQSESYDRGRTWKPAWQTDIPNPSSMANLLRLPNGYIVLIHNNCGGVVGEKPARRSPLSVWVSRDEMTTWFVKEDILFGGDLTYPNGYLLQDGKLVFVYDYNRREVRYVEVDFN